MGMLRSAASKAMWVGRTASAVFGLALVLALVLGVATMAFAANGQNLVLGVLNNTATAVTKLTGNVAGKPALQVNNFSTASGSRALQLGVAEGKAPLVVNANAGKATNLNADKLDGKDSGELGGARAYAFVTPVPFSDSVVLDGNRTFGFTAVRRNATGSYCLTPASGVRPDRFPAVVSVEFASTNNPKGNTTAVYNTLGCGDQLNNTYQVLTYRDGVLANDIGFSIVVP